MARTATSERAVACRCVVCGGASRRVFEIEGYWIRECELCAHRSADLSDTRAHVERVYGDEYFKAGGAGYSDYLREEPLLLARGRWYATLVSRYMSKGSALDVGAAAGFALRALADDGWQVRGIEPNASMASYARLHNGVAVDLGSFEAFAPNERFNLVTMLQVVAHFVDPRQAMRKAARIVVPGGHLLIETWDRMSRAARWSGRSWHEYSPPSVLHMFSREGLIRLVADTGFALVAQGRPLKRISAGHAKSLLRHKAKNSLRYRILSAAAAILPEETALPYPGDDLFWALFRRNP